MKTSIYDNPIFFESYLKLRTNPISLNEIVEKPTMFSLLPSLEGKRLLDLGCGAGGHLQTYLKQGASFVAGLDLSAQMLQEAEREFANLGFNPTAYSLHQLPMEALLELPHSEFDVITSSFAFHYVADFPKLLADIKAKLKPQGWLIFSQEHPIVTCHKEEDGDRWEKGVNKAQRAYRLRSYREEGERRRNWFQQGFKTYHRTTATLLNQLIAAGFVIEQVEEPMLANQPEWHDEFKDLAHRPVLLFVKARLA
ncbi:hypothetical protein A4G20_10210 [Pasteurellaceae bacterium RH1A]|nr:hypothetical protein A4G20_10210 [Pasteurellaceae bacterium RH1A]